MTITRRVSSQPTQHVVWFSGGAGSWATAKLVREHVDPENLWMVFADTKIEDPDLYRFLQEGAANVGGWLVTIADGRTPWEVFKDVRFLGNHRLDPCSRILKRELMRRWLEDNFYTSQTVVYLGIDWTEEHRYTKAQKFWSPWQVEAPLVERTDLDKEKVFKMLEAEGIELPDLYKLGFQHNNCGGGCVKAGHATFKLLLEKKPETYAAWEREEQGLRDYLGKDVTILTDRSGGRSGAQRRPMTLQEFRLKLVAGEQIDTTDWGGCGCFSPNEYEDDSCGVQSPSPLPTQERRLFYPAVLGRAIDYLKEHRS